MHRVVSHIGVIGTTCGAFLILTKTNFFHFALNRKSFCRFNWRLVSLVKDSLSRGTNYAFVCYS